jgi:hypothetical protein
MQFDLPAAAVCHGWRLQGGHLCSYRQAVVQLYSCQCAPDTHRCRVAGAAAHVLLESLWLHVTIASTTQRMLSHLTCTSQHCCAESAVYGPLGVVDSDCDFRVKLIDLSLPTD